MPSFHIHGIVASILAPLVSGGKIVVLPKFNALSFFKSLEKVIKEYKNESVDKKQKQQNLDKISSNI